MRKITDKLFIYTPSFETDIGKRFRRIIAAQKASAKARAEQDAKIESERGQKLVPMVRKGAK